MKLKELLDEVFKNAPLVQNSIHPLEDYSLYGKKHLEPLKDRLLQCDEFKEFSDLVIVDSPTFELHNKPVVAQTYKLGDDTKFTGVGYLLSLALTPKMYDPKELYKPVKDGAVITPALYDPMTFLPIKRITLEFSPEMAQDQQMANGEAILRQRLHDLLDRVLDSPEEYRPEGHRGIMVRGVFNTTMVS